MICDLDLVQTEIRVFDLLCSVFRECDVKEQNAEILFIADDPHLHCSQWRDKTTDLTSSDHCCFNMSIMFLVTL